MSTLAGSLIVRTTLLVTVDMEGQPISIGSVRGLRVGIDVILSPTDRSGRL